MSKAMKAVLWSGLVFPGAGHLFLKHYRRGAALIVISLVCLSFIVLQAVQQATAVLGKIEMDGGPIDPEKLANMVAQASNGSGNDWADIATILLAACWIAGMTDAYRLGKKIGG